MITPALVPAPHCGLVHALNDIGNTARGYSFAGQVPPPGCATSGAPWPLPRKTGIFPALLLLLAFCRVNTVLPALPFLPFLPFLPVFPVLPVLPVLPFLPCLPFYRFYVLYPSYRFLPFLQFLPFYRARCCRRLLHFYRFTVLPSHCWTA